ncbi:MAG: chloride channel protein [Candidatus Nitronauta litoralis]|uniref:Chloride channel protein n=1 Tax=Candidatus Nitronauta litoralis TaxID=2705533 RepID=A0A7T0BXK3_9BACT|nr:MAG: chloride channel protein [Candidatus Nitronauta litoralis]
MDTPHSSFFKEAKKFLGQDHNLLFLAGVIGFLAGAAATLFRWMIQLFDWGLSEQGLGLLGIPSSGHGYLLWMMPMLGGLMIGIYVHFFPDAVKENGVHKVIQAVAINNGKIRKRTLWHTAFTSSLTIGSGGSAGREGPTVQIGAAIGSALAQMFHLSTERVQVLVGCGASAGIAASFNAPLAGVLFAMEIILGEFTVHTFSPIVVASVIGTVTGRALEGNEVTFQIPIHELVHSGEIVFYLVMGILCGLMAWVFTLFYFFSSRFFENHVKAPQWSKPAIGGLVVGLISILFPQILGNGYEAMEDALNGNLFWGMAFGLIFLKIIATGITIGSGGLGGVFAPSLFVGAMVGAAFGHGVHTLFPEMTASAETYAVVGMGAVAGAVMQAPLTNILMLFEMTNDYTIILPIMIACIAATYTFRSFNKNSIYIQYLLNKGINLRHGRVVSILSSMHVRDVMNKDVVTIPEEMPFRSILNTVSYSKNFYYPVVDQQGDMIGILSFSDIREAAFEGDLEHLVVASDIATKNVESLRPNHNLNEAMETFNQLDLDQLPVVKVGDPKKVIGLVSRQDVLAMYNREILMHKVED